MQPQDAEIQKAKATITPCFVDKYGRPKKTPYYVTQLQTLFENNHFPWIIYQAADQLAKQGFLSKFETKTKYHEKVVFIYNAQLDTPKHKPTLEAHIKSICKLVDKYSTPTIGRALGNHLEGLVKAELRAQGFNIVGTHTTEYQDKKWLQTSHNLDFIAEHTSKKLTVGVEVKNTLPIIEREELDIKLKICQHLGITPLFAVRWLKPYIEHIRSNGGFSWIFKTQIYPPGFEQLTRTLYNRLGLPVSVRTELPEKTIEIFHRWVQSIVSK
jgi:hypothetical protein